MTSDEYYNATTIARDEAEGKTVKEVNDGYEVFGLLFEDGTKVEVYI